MRNVRWIVVVVVALAVAAGVAPAAAQDAGNRAAASAEPAPVTLTPFVSLGSPTSSRVGGAVAFLVAPRTSVEAEVGYRGGLGGGVSTSVGLVYDLPSLGRITPYVAGGVGLEEYTTAERSSNTGFFVAHRTGLTVNAGGGIRAPIDRNWGLRTDARWFNGLGTHSPERWRVYNGVTFGTGGTAP